MEQNTKPDIGSIVFGAAIGATALGLLSQYEETQARKSQSEIDAPEEADEIYSDVDDFLEHFQFSENLSNENQYQAELVNALNSYLQNEIEHNPAVAGMKPDILIDGLVAIEMKLSPSKVEIDRLVGQLAGYAQEWKTLIILIDTPRSRIRYLEVLLTECCLDHLEIIAFS